VRVKRVVGSPILQHGPWTGPHSEVLLRSPTLAGFFSLAALFLPCLVNHRFKHLDDKPLLGAGQLTDLLDLLL
jgi:hypothetical protein